MPDYSKGQIYSIKFNDNNNLFYIGSTIQPLAKRFGGHKLLKSCSLYQYIQDNYNGDFKACYIELIENFECNNKQELNKLEGEIIRQYKADNNYVVINKNIAGRTDKEYYKDNADTLKENKKQYRQENKDKIKEYHKQYRQENADKIKEHYKENANKIKQYQQENKDKIKEYNKQYRQENGARPKDL